MQSIKIDTTINAVFYVVQHKKRYINSRICSIFAPTVQTTLSVRTASQSLSFASIYNVIVLPLYNAQLTIISKIIVPAVHTVRSASGSFFLYTYAK